MALSRLEQLEGLWIWQEKQWVYPQVYDVEMLSLQLAVGTLAAQLYTLSYWFTCQELIPLDIYTCAPVEDRMDTPDAPESDTTAVEKEVEWHQLAAASSYAPSLQSRVGQP